MIRFCLILISWIEYFLPFDVHLDNLVDTQFAISALSFGDVVVCTDVILPIGAPRLLLLSAG